MKKLITTAALSFCATLSAMEKPETKLPKGPGKSIVKLRKLREPNTQMPTRESKLVKGPEMKFVNLRPLTGRARL